MSEPTTNRYRLFGGTLGTVLEIPELHRADHGSGLTWQLEVHLAQPAPSMSEPVLATDEIPGAAQVTIRSSNGVVRLDYTDTGTFDVAPDGSRIDWYRPREVDETLARTDVLGRVMAVAAHRSGILTLHASAVAIDDRIVGFMAPKFYGKSTLACALADAGASLVTDDALALRGGDGVVGGPGVPAVRLRQESAMHLRRVPATLPDESGEWRHTERMSEQMVVSDWMPVDALYVLSPVSPEWRLVERTPIPAIPAAMTMVRHAKLGALLAGPLAVEYLERATSIVTSVPVFELRYPRDLSLLDDLTGRVLEWHRQ